VIAVVAVKAAMAQVSHDVELIVCHSKVSSNKRGQKNATLKKRSFTRNSDLLFKALDHSSTSHHEAASVLHVRVTALAGHDFALAHPL
jgi:hypothetical protein